MATEQAGQRPALAPGTVRKYLALADELRDLQEHVVAAVPPPDVSEAALAHVRAAGELLQPWAVDVLSQLAGRLDRAPGRGHTFAPITQVDELGNDHLRARVVFRRFHVGVGAVHGGAVSIVFDELLGQLARAGTGHVPRTAYLNTAYRSLTPAGKDLTVDGAVTRSDGRKRFVTGTLLDGDRVCAEAEGLFVLSAV